MDEIVPLCWLYREAEQARSQGSVVCMLAYGWLCAFEQPRIVFCAVLLTLHQAHPSMQLSKLETVALLNEMRQSYRQLLESLFAYRRLAWWCILLVMCLPAWCIKLGGLLLILGGGKKGGWWSDLRALHSALTGGLVVECQRWWLGIGWLPCSTPGDPPDWAHWPSLFPVTGQLVGNYQPLAQASVTDPLGWQYGNGRWSDWHPASKLYTRRRFWRLEQ